MQTQIQQGMGIRVSWKFVSRSAALEGMMLWNLHLHVDSLRGSVHAKIKERTH